MTTTTTAGPAIDFKREINAAFNARDVDRILSFFAEDATFLMARGPEPCGRRVHGKEAIGRILADRFKVVEHRNRHRPHHRRLRHQGLNVALQQRRKLSNSL